MTEEIREPEPKAEKVDDPMAKVRALIAEEVAKQVDELRQETALALNDMTNAFNQQLNYLAGYVAGVGVQAPTFGEQPVDDSDIPAP